MFEKLQRIRAEVERNGKRLEEDQKKYDDSLARLKRDGNLGFERYDVARSPDGEHIGIDRLIVAAEFG